MVTIYENGEKKDSYQINLGTIVIDPGHGGEDPGKVSSSGNCEKDINLKIGMKLKPLLEAEGFKVVLTRETDTSICTGSYGKTEDLRNRIDIVRDAEAMFVISIHQNSYPSADVKGAQVFYTGTQSEGERLANLIQSEFSELDTDNKRQAKENNDYYLFTHCDIPIVIAECGFLSCPEEEEKLLSDSYQEEIARSIALGIKKYLSNK